MGTEKKSGKTVETEIALSLHAKFQRKVKKENTSMAQVLRDFIQHYVKQIK